MKFATTKYTMFKNRFVNLSVAKGQVFAVTKEIENTASFQEGVATKNITYVEVKSEYQLDQVVNVTDEIRAEFRGATPVPVPTVVISEPIIVIQEPTFSESIPDVGVLMPSFEETVPEVIEDVMVLAFTEEAGNVTNALLAVSEETDIAKLEHALELDERKSIRKAIRRRIEELK